MTLNLMVFLTRSLSHWRHFLVVFQSLKTFHVEIATLTQQSETRKDARTFSYSTYLNLRKYLCQFCVSQNAVCAAQHSKLFPTDQVSGDSITPLPLCTDLVLHYKIRKSSKLSSLSLCIQCIVSCTFCRYWKSGASNFLTWPRLLPTNPE